MQSIIRHEDPVSLYAAAITRVQETQATGRNRRISLASIHALAEHRADASSELTRGLRAAMLDRVREGWSLSRIVSITTVAGLERELQGLALIDAIPDARVEVRAVVVDAVPVLAPLVIGGQAAFVSLEDDRDFGVSEGLEFRSEETVAVAQAYFDLLWGDPRSIRLRTSAAGTSESGIGRAEAELRAFAKYQRHRDERGLAGGSSEAIEAYLSAERRFDAEMHIRKAIRSLQGRILWYEAHHSVNSLDMLYEAVAADAVHDVCLMSGDQNLRDNPKRTCDRFEKFADEMFAKAEIRCEWRILPSEQTRGLHGRVLLDNEGAITIPPLNSILKGTVDVIRVAGERFDRTPYVEAWESAEPIETWRRRLQG